MKNLIKIIVAVCFLNSMMVLAQNPDNKLKKANDYYDNFAYIDAIVAYEEIVKEGNANVEIYQKLGDSYYFNSDLESAAKWYQKMIDTGEEIDGVYYFRAAQSFKFLKEYEIANSYMDELKKKNKEDSRVQRYLANPDYLEDIKTQSGRYSIKNMESNSSFTDFAPSFREGQLVFSSSREKGKFSDQLNKWTQQPYLQLYGSYIEEDGGITDPEEFSERLTTRLHESTSTFTKDGKTIYFTRNNLLNSKFEKDSIDVNRLKIYTANANERDKWRAIKELSFNNDQYSVAHPALSPDGKQLYFASDMPGGYGMSDLYVVAIMKNGTFGIPKNLGPKINTEGRDTFPFISQKGRLYFASDGHLGLGGLDIFVTSLDDKEQQVYNVGEPVNSSADDMTFIIDDTTQKGYFASNRPGGKGKDDVYSMVELSPVVTKCNGSIKGIAMDETSGALLANAAIEIKDNEGKIIYAGKTDTEGTFSLKVDCNDKTYSITATKKDYNSVEKQVKVTKTDPNSSQTLKLKNNAPEKGVDLAKLLKLKPIYFASNKATILDDSAIELDKVEAFMKKYPFQ